MVEPRTLPIDVPHEEIAAFCRRNRIRRLAFFGSVLRDDFGPDSDIDVLVEFEEGQTPGLAFFGMGRELEELFGRKVDFLTPGFLNKYIKERVLAEALPIYDAA
jgi:uncharacterized protein